MDRVIDGGTKWRSDIKGFLDVLGVIVLNPCNKPIPMGREDELSREHIHSLKMSGNFDEVSKLMREVRSIDLRMVDISDFVILNIDTSVHMCGSYEELSLANRQKKPILVHVEQGKVDCPNWVFGTIPHEHIFDSWKDLRLHLTDIAVSGPNHKRWVLFDLQQKYEEITNVSK